MLDVLLTRSLVKQRELVGLTFEHRLKPMEKPVVEQQWLVRKFNHLSDGNVKKGHAAMDNLLRH